MSIEKNRIKKDIDQAIEQLRCIGENNKPKEVKNDLAKKSVKGTFLALLIIKIVDFFV